MRNMLNPQYIICIREKGAMNTGYTPCRKYGQGLHYKCPGEMWNSFRFADNSHILTETLTVSVCAWLAR